MGAAVSQWDVPVPADELGEWALVPASGIAESLQAAGLDARCSGAALPEEVGMQQRPMLELDLRGLPAPEPMLRALAAADALAPGAVLVVRTPLLPVPLLHALAERGLQACAQVLPDGSARVEITRPGSGVHGAGGTVGDGETHP